MSYLWLQKKIGQQFFSPPLFVLLLDPGSEIGYPVRIQIRIRDKHPGSVTLIGINEDAQLALHETNLDAQWASWNQSRCFLGFFELIRMRCLLGTNPDVLPGPLRTTEVASPRSPQQYPGTCWSGRHEPPETPDPP